MATIEIISSSSCPFAQRTRMAALEKGLDSKLTEIDLENKPDWFVRISPYGKVPVVRHGDTVVFESAVINEYLEDAFPERPLLPGDLALRARARTWIDFANVRLVPHFYKVLLAQDADEQSLHKRKILEALEFMEFKGLRKRRDGPYWLGGEITLVDLTFFPHMDRFCAIEHYRAISIPQDCIHLRDWLTLMKASASVQATGLSDSMYIRNWRKYAFNTSTGTTARDMRES